MTDQTKRIVIEADLNVYFTLELEDPEDQDMRLDYIVDGIKEFLEDEFYARDVEVDIAATGPIYA